MRRLAPAFIALFFLASSVSLTAQEPGPAHAPDFRAPQKIAPLYFPPKPNAPFMAIAKTVWVQTLPDGSTVTRQNQRIVARDMDGRIFQERRTFIPVPGDGKQQPLAYLTVYTDPVDHTICSCDPHSRVCNLFSFNGMGQEAPLPAGLQHDGTSFLTRENLGADTFQGLDVQRSRETFTYYRQTIGNTNTILRVVDYWYSPSLGVNVQVKRHDPRDGDQTLWLTDISLTAADPETFKPPAGYRVYDRRETKLIY